MRRTFLILLLLFMVSCQKKFDANSSDIVILNETDTFTIYTSKELFENHFKGWIKKHNYILEDKKLFETIMKKNESKNINAFKTAEDINLLNRLEFRTADLLENNNAYIYNKLLKSNQKFYIEKTEDCRKFKVGNKIVFYTVDRIY